MTSDLKNQLIKAAIDVRKSAYAPYSKFYVGASILCEDGSVFTGSNYENVSFGAGVCAERVALGQALSQGKRKFIAVCVAGEKEDITPCGICRQSLTEFGDMYIICCNKDGDKVREYKLSELLPSAFGSL